MNEINELEQKKTTVEIADEIVVLLGSLDVILGTAIDLLGELPVPRSEVRHLQAGLHQIRSVVKIPVRNINNLVRRIADASTARSGQKVEQPCTH